MNKQKKLFSKIYDKNVNKIYRFVYLKVNSADRAEDITSQVFMKGWEAFQKKGSRIKNPSAFLYQIARNLLVDFYRKRDQADIVPADKLQMSDPGQDLEKDAQLNSDIATVKQSLNKLKPDYQNVIIWHYLDDMPIASIAKVMNKSEGAVRVTLHRALKKIKKNIKES